MSDPSPEKEIHLGVIAAWIGWHALRCLGFCPDQIFVGAVTGDFMGQITKVVRVELRVAGRELGFHLGLWEGDPAVFEPEWLELYNQIQSDAISEERLRAWWEHGQGPDLTRQFAEALNSVGIRIPALSKIDRSLN